MCLRFSRRQVLHRYHLPVYVFREEENFLSFESYLIYRRFERGKTLQKDEKIFEKFFRAVFPQRFPHRRAAPRGRFSSETYGHPQQRRKKNGAAIDLLCRICPVKQRIESDDRHTQARHDDVVDDVIGGGERYAQYVRDECAREDLHYGSVGVVDAVADGDELEIGKEKGEPPQHPHVILARKGVFPAVMKYALGTIFTMASSVEVLSTRSIPS